MSTTKKEEGASLVESMSANALLNSFDSKQIVSLIIEIEKQAATMDVTTPLYKYFKTVVEKEDPNSL